MLNISPIGNPYRHEVVSIPSDSQKKAVHWPGQDMYFQVCSSYRKEKKALSFFFLIKLLCFSLMGVIFTQRAPVLFQTQVGHELGIMHTNSEKL